MIEHVRESDDVNTPRGDVGGYQHPHSAGLEDAQRLLPSVTWGADPENAYIAALKAYLQEHGPEDLKYLAFALDVELIDADKLEKALQKYCDCHGIEVLPSSDYQWLKENGYIFFTGMDSYNFPNGARLWVTDSKEINLTALQDKMPKNSFVVDIGQFWGNAYAMKRIGFMWFVIRKDTSWVI